MSYSLQSAKHSFPLSSKNISSKFKGIAFTMLSAVLFGLTPMLTSLTYSMGGTPETATFFRNLFAAPVLLLILIVRKIPFSLPGTILRNVMLCGVIGGGITTLLLYTSYQYVGIGTATTLHFLYPVFVCLICRMVFKERLGIQKIIVLLIAGAGIFCFLDIGKISRITGLILAVVSGLTYAVYMIGVEKKKIDALNPYVVTFYIAVSVSIFMLLYNIPTKNIVLHMPVKAYFYIFATSVLTSVLAVLMLQLGIKYLGASTAAIFCLFEPVTSIICGAVFLKEIITGREIIGCILVSLAVIILATNAKMNSLPQNKHYSN